jgi:hypothetical protein
MAAKGITLYCAGCEPSLKLYRPFFMAICLATGGRYVPLNSADKLVASIIDGAREEMCMEKMMARVSDELMNEAALKGVRVNKDELTKRIQAVISNKKLDAGLEIDAALEVTNEIKELSCKLCLRDVADFIETKNMFQTPIVAKGSSIFSSFSSSLTTLLPPDSPVSMAVATTTTPVSIVSKPKKARKVKRCAVTRHSRRLLERRLRPRKLSPVRVDLRRSVRASVSKRSNQKNIAAIGIDSVVEDSTSRRLAKKALARSMF